MKPNKCQHAAGLTPTGLSERKREREINNNKQCNSDYRTNMMLRVRVRGEQESYFT